MPEDERLEIAEAIWVSPPRLTLSLSFIPFALAWRMVLINGTEYAGEIKKSVFSAMNYVLPKQRGLLKLRVAASDP